VSNDRNDLQQLPKDDPQGSPGVQKVIVLVGPLKPLGQWLEE